MADSSPAHARRRPALVLAAIAVLVAAGITVAVALAHHPGRTGRTGGKLVAPPVAEPSSSSAQPSSAPSSSAPDKAPTRTKPAVPHEAVAATAPTSFTY